MRVPLEILLYWIIHLSELVPNELNGQGNVFQGCWGRGIGAPCVMDSLPRGTLVDVGSSNVGRGPVSGRAELDVGELPQNIRSFINMPSPRQVSLRITC